MKNILALAICMTGSIAFCQHNFREDTTCFRSQWIAVPNDSAHSFFFSSDDQKDLFSVIYQLNRAEKLSIYNAESFSNSCCFDNYVAERNALKDDSIRKYYDIEMGWYVTYTAFLSSFSHNQTDENGEYIYYVDSLTGEEKVLRTRPDIVNFGINTIVEMRIHEKKNKFIEKDPYDYSSDYEEDPEAMSIVEISFAAYDFVRTKEMFTIDFDLFMLFLQGSDIDYENLPWYRMLMDKTYKGFRYSQSSCYDYVVR